MPNTVASGAAMPIIVRLGSGWVAMMYATGRRTINICIMDWIITKKVFPCPLKYPMNEKSTAVTIASGAKPFRYSAERIITPSSVAKMCEILPPQKNARRNMNTPIPAPIAIPVTIVFFALSSLPAPTFFAMNDERDCIIDDGISITNVTILFATPYPPDASRPRLLMNAIRARNEIRVMSS